MSTAYYRFVGRLIIFTLAIGFFVNSINAQVNARDFYVATNGHDTQCTGLSPKQYPGNGGPQLDCAFRTIQKAINSAYAGDTIFVRSGIYNTQLIIVKNGSASGGYITLTNYANEQVIIDGSNLTIMASAGLIDIRNSSYLKIKGLIVQNSDDSAIYVRSSHHVVIENNTTNKSHSSGVGVWHSDQIKVIRNKITNARYVVMPHGHEESISIASTTNFEVSYNDISMSGYDGLLGNEGIDVKEASRYGKVHHNHIHDYPKEGGAIYLDAWNAVNPSLSNIDVYNNKIANTGSGIVIGSERGGTAENINIFNNIISKPIAVGIGIPGKQGDGIRRNINIFNNTISEARYNGGAGIYITTSNISNIAIKNNLVNFTNWNGQITASTASVLPHITATHNMVVTTAKKCSQEYPNCIEISANPSGYAMIHSNFTADPQFISTTDQNFHLKSSSPAIDKGVDLRPLVTTDYDNVTRMQGNGFDIGAYEYASSPPPIKMGDANNDGQVNESDYSIWLSNYLNPQATLISQGNFNTDKLIDGVDYVIWLTHLTD
jgi:hypothetical protein